MSQEDENSEELEEKAEIVEEPQETEEMGEVAKREAPEEDQREYDGERILTVSFFPEALSVPKWNRAGKAARILKKDVKKRIKYVEDPLSGRETRIRKPAIKIAPQLNDKLHDRGGKKIPRKMRVRVQYKVQDPDRGRVELRVNPI